jgi:hypothetical protein
LTSKKIKKNLRNILKYYFIYFFSDNIKVVSIKFIWIIFRFERLFFYRENGRNLKNVIFYKDRIILMKFDSGAGLHWDLLLIGFGIEFKEIILDNLGVLIRV